MFTRTRTRQLVPPAASSLTSTTTTDRPRGRRGLARAVVASVLAVAVLPAMMTTSASAAVTWYGAQGSAGATSSTVTHAFTVSPSTTPMTGYDRGQSVVYRVAARDVTSATPGAWSTYAWQGPWVVSRSSSTTCVVTPNDLGSGCTNITTDTSKTGLGGFRITGYAGHRYQAIVQLGYWVGTGYSYTGWFYASDCINTYVLQGATFTAHGASCGT